MFRQAAEQGHDWAQLFYGDMYRKGEGVPQDYAEAVKWFRRAAEQGNVAAQVNLSFMYEKGYGVPQDFVQAHMWRNLAAAQGTQGNGDMRKQRDEIAKKMTPAQIAEAQRLAREWLEKHGQ